MPAEAHRPKRGLTVSAGYAGALADVAVRCGAPRGALLSAAGIAPEALRDPDARLPFEAFRRLMAAGKTLTGEPALALHFGASHAFQDLSIVGLVCRRARTMGEAFAQMNRYGRLVIDIETEGAGPRFRIEQARGRLWIVDTRRNPDDFPELTESTIARFICTFRGTFPDLAFYKSADVTYPAPAHAEAYTRILGVPVRFGAVWNAMEIDPAWPSLTLSEGSEFVFGSLARPCRDPAGPAGRGHKCGRAC